MEQEKQNVLVKGYKQDSKNGLNSHIAEVEKNLSLINKLQAPM